MNERQMLMQKIAAYDFAIVELNLYLDTHPNDVQAKRRLSDSEHKSRELRKEYESKFGAIVFSSSPDIAMSWIKDPWPWDICREGS